MFGGDAGHETLPFGAEAERLAQVQAEADQAAEEKARVAKRRAEEKARFEQEQARLEEKEAERKRLARLHAEREAAALQDDLYGGFDDNDD